MTVVDFPESKSKIDWGWYSIRVEAMELAIAAMPTERDPGVLIDAAKQIAEFLTEKASK